MVGSIVPRPIALVSTVDQGNVRNLAPFSYFTACSSNPPVVVFCPILRPAPPLAKDTLRNILATREFVVNIVSEEFVERMNATAAQVGPEVDEFELSGLTPIASDLVKPPRVGGKPCAYGVPAAPGGAGERPARWRKPGAGRSAALSCRARTWSRTSASIRTSCARWAAWQARLTSAPPTVSSSNDRNYTLRRNVLGS